jgi:hypothetical protein
MVTLAYDRYDYKRKQPYPNGWNELFCKYAETLDGNEWFNVLKTKFKISANHSEFRGNILMKYGGKYNIIKDIDFQNYNGELLFYPIEIFGDHNAFVNKNSHFTNDGVEYYTNFEKVVSTEAIELAKRNKLIFVINESHEPLSDYNFINTLHNDIKSIGLNPNSFIIFGGTSNLFDLYPQLNNIGFNFYFEDNLLISSCKKVIDLKENSFYTLGYKSEWFEKSDILTKRNKHFVCPNRNSNKHHRFSLGCFIESENLWNKMYCSFLQKTETIPIYESLEKNFLFKLKSFSTKFLKKLPIEMDTHNLNESDKQSFESMRAFKKEIYLDSYIHIITETNFLKDIFPTEKLINPITTLQPFILFGAPGYLNYIKRLGFKTFDGFIDESYDLEMDDMKRFKMLCDEIKRISEISLDEIHNWYISIIPILEYNRNHAIEFANKPMFIESLKNYKWNLQEKKLL